MLVGWVDKEAVEMVSSLGRLRFLPFGPKGSRFRPQPAWDRCLVETFGIESVMLSTGLLLVSLLLGPNLPFDPTESAPMEFSIGDEAPALQVDEWIKGPKVDAFIPGKIYVVVFWGSWCGPCMESIPLLSELQDRFAGDGVTLIGLNTESPKADDLASIKTVVADLGNTLRFPIAWEAKPLSLGKYMFSNGRKDLPLAFLVDGQGELAFFGLPEQLESPLARLVAGDWDAELEAEIAETRVALKQPIDALRKATQHSIEGAAAALVLEQWLLLISKNPEMRVPLAPLYYRMLVAAGLEDKAAKMGGQLADRYIAVGQSNELNQLAWSIVDPKRNLKHRDLDLALRASQVASDMQKGTNPDFLNTMARVYFLKDDAKSALTLQTLAVALAPEKMKAALEKTLQEYRRASGN
ncbi:MAG: thiol-disulfide isomerase/thioredoxin [Glaciecola sp.]|jgi:thiol-disulfide isomerase/thioredoxin